MAAPVDRAHLDRLATRFGAHFLLQLIDLFIAQGRERLQAAERGASEGDITGIIGAAHALKSSAGNLGAATLGQCAAEIERRGMSGATVETLTPMVATLSEAFAAACTTLEAARADIERRTTHNEPIA
jgi:HPt (histidine-containing phosphotransfer) domain-containing protein